ncbi:MAG: hypothetical protein IKR34_08090 [Candidatus Gastranaerophilales bacterium]|nr:hypothetical protein [Candidatus Gastranaerophilales bacterium]
MLLDAQNLFSDEQAITTGTIYSTNIVKFGKNDVSFVPVIIQSVADFSDLTSLTVKVQTDDNPNFTNAVDLFTSQLAKADLTAGSKFPISYLPRGNKGYIRLAYVVTGTTETTGKITAGVVAGDGLEIQEI